MASKQRRIRRRKNNRNVIVWAAVVGVVAIVALVIIVNNKTKAAGPQISFDPPAPAALDKCGTTTCGDANAPVTIDVYADFQCPYCAQFEPALEQLGPNYIDTGKVKLIFHNFAFIGAESDMAAQAAMCAGDQNKFWMFANDLYRHQGAENSGVFASSNLKGLAAAAGMDSSKFNSCLDSGKYAAAVQQQTAEGRQRQVQATPTFFVNGQIHEGGVSYDQLVGLVNAAMSK
jgi:protein-disulfide isomerase